MEMGFTARLKKSPVEANRSKLFDCGIDGHFVAMYIACFDYKS